MQKPPPDELPATRALEGLLQEQLELNPPSPVQTCKKRPFNMAAMFQIASDIDEEALDFPAIGWCRDNDNHDDGLCGSKSSERHRSILERSSVPLSHCVKRQKRNCDEMPYLVRTKSLTVGLASFGSCIKKGSKEQEQTISELSSHSFNPSDPA
jgi:hypothetical protein